jgi:cation transport regulator ChaB
VGTVPARQDLPNTLLRSSPKAQETWIKTHDSAVGEYGEGQRAHRVAFAALKHSFEKIGDHWEEKGRRGPSDAQAARTIRDKPVRTAGGVDANASKNHLMEVARRLDIKGRSSMTRDNLVQAIKKSNARKTSDARQPRKARTR